MHINENQHLHTVLMTVNYGIVLIILYTLCLIINNKLIYTT